MRNAILASLSPQDLLAIGKFLEPIVLKDRLVLQEPGKPVEYVYFIESGIVSLRIVAAGSSHETAVVGYRGAIGASFLLGGHLPTHQSMVLFPGRAYRINVGVLCDMMNDLPQVRERLSRYVVALGIHSAQMGLCGVRHDLEQRLACWLCLTCDAFDSSVLPVTHGYISDALGMPRSGVTERLIRFEEQKLIRKLRGVLQVDDRKRLEQKACRCYGVISNAYECAEHPTSARQDADFSVPVIPGTEV